jgi:hypothetical protein
MATYAEKLKDPRWQKKRLKVLERDGWACRGCFDSENTLVVHHLVYFKDKEPWDYPDVLLLTLCQECHEIERQHRPLVEQTLLDILKEKGFLCGDVAYLNGGFIGMKMMYVPDVMAAALGWGLRNPDIIQIILDEYFKSIASKPEKHAVDNPVDNL